MQSAMQIVSVPLGGFIQGITPIISYNYGAGNKQRVKEAIRVTFMVMVTFNLVLFLAMIVFPETVASIFASDAELIRVVGEVLPMFLAGMTIFGLQRSCQTAFVALGQAGISLFIAMLRKIILLIPLALILPCFVQPAVYGVYLAEPIADAVAALTCTVIFIFVFRRVMRETDKAAE